MTVSVFLGPTLPVSEARAVLPALYLPPVRQGDVYRTIINHRPRAIGIIDGHFHQVPSVWHKEILWAMANGVHVFGSASMGALRAAELDQFGMEGVGRVFSAYRNRVLEDDDEVAVVHGPAELDFVASSEAMVNMRWTFDAAKSQSILTPSTAEQLTAMAKARFYPERSYRDVLKQAETAGLPKSELKAFSAWLEQGRIDAKRDDALAMLRRMHEILTNDLPPKSVDYAFEHTTMWDGAISAVHPSNDDGEDRDGSAIDSWLMDELRLDDAYDQLRQAALLRLLARDEADRQGLRVDGDEHREAITTFRLERSLNQGADFRAWLLARDLDRGDLDRIAEDKLLQGKVADRLGKQILRFVKDELRLGEHYERLIARARAKRQILEFEDADQELTDDISAVTWYFQQSAVALPENLDSHARRLGFRDGADFRRAVMRDYRYRQISDEADSFL